MPVETAADRALFLDTDEFGDTATIGVNSFPGILGNEYIEVGEINSTAPGLLCDEAVAVAAGAVIGATIAILVSRTGVSSNYTIRVLQPDGTGMLTLILEKQ